MLGALLVACALAPAMATGASHHPRATPVPQGFVGMNVDGPTWPDASVNLAQQLGVMVQSGVENVRATFDWSLIQPYQSMSEVPPDVRADFTDVDGIPTDFTQTDQLMQLASERRLTVAPVILNAPSWAGQSWTGGIVDLPRSDAQFATFVKTLVQRYGAGGIFWKTASGPREPITMWQIWNEPDIYPAFWPTTHFAERYVGLLRAAHAAIKSVDPSAKVVLAGLANYSWKDLESIYRVRGARSDFDIVSVHPYTKYPKGVITIIGYVRQVMDENGDASKPIVADEVSWPSSLGHTIHNVGYDFATTEAGQANNIAHLLPMLVRDRTRLGLLGFDYYDWAGLERENYLAFDFAGLFKLETDGQFVAKPAYYAFSKGALAMEGCKTKTVATRCS